MGGVLWVKRSGVWFVSSITRGQHRSITYLPACWDMFFWCTYIYKHLNGSCNSNVHFTIVKIYRLTFWAPGSMHRDYQQCCGRLWWYVGCNSWHTGWECVSHCYWAVPCKAFSLGCLAKITKNLCFPRTIPWRWHIQLYSDIGEFCFLELSTLVWMFALIFWWSTFLCSQNQNSIPMHAV